jgi:hypothetical protein
MCCFFSSLWLLGPRFAFLIAWLIPYGRLKVAAAFSGWILPLLGLIFLPWTTLMYVIVFPVYGVFDWLFLAFAVFADISAYAAGAYRRKDAPFYSGP